MATQQPHDAFAEHPLLQGPQAMQRANPDWWNVPAHFPGTTSLFDSVFSWRHLNDLLNYMPLECGEIHVVRSGSRVEFAAVRDQARSVIAGTDVADPSKVLAHVREGYSLGLFSLDRRSPSVSCFLRRLNRAWPHRFNVSGFFSPVKGSAFAPHQDFFPAFVLQVEGSKTWYFGGNSGNWVDRTRPITVHKGDVLFFPRGMTHCAEASKEASLHLTVRAMVSGAGDALEKVLERDRDRGGNLERDWLLSAAGFSGDSTAKLDGVTSSPLPRDLLLESLNETWLGERDPFTEVQLPGDLRQTVLLETSLLRSRHALGFRLQWREGRPYLLLAGREWPWRFPSSFADRMFRGAEFRLNTLLDELPLERREDFVQYVEQFFQSGVLDVV